MAAPALAQDVKWVSLYTDRDGETFYDPASLKRVGDRVTLSLRSVAKDAAGWSAIMKLEIDCKAQTMGFLAGQEFGEGKLLRERTVDPGKIDRQPLYEGEDVGPVYRIACPKGAALRTYPAGPPIVVVPPK